MFFTLFLVQLDMYYWWDTLCSLMIHGARTKFPVIVCHHACFTHCVSVCPFEKQYIQVAGWDARGRRNYRLLVIRLWIFHPPLGPLNHGTYTHATTVTYGSIFTRNLHVLGPIRPQCDPIRGIGFPSRADFHQGLAKNSSCFEVTLAIDYCWVVSWTGDKSI